MHKIEGLINLANMNIYRGHYEEAKNMLRKCEPIIFENSSFV